MKIIAWLSVRRAEFRAWSWRGAHFFLWCASIALAIGFLGLSKWLQMPGKVDDHIRWLACIFEFFGVMLVIAGVDKSRRSFGRPSIFGTSVTWLKDSRYFFIRRPATSATLNASGASFMLTTGTVHVVAHGSSIEERLEWLKRQISEVNERIDTAMSQFKEQETRFCAALKAEEVSRAVADKEVLTRLEENMIGDFGVELLGAGFLVVGLVLSNLTQEVAMLAHWFWGKFVII
jgi:hypothetical protein